MPAPMPSATAIRPSSSDRLQPSGQHELKPAEICAVGPSRPAEPPEPIVSALDTILTTHPESDGARIAVHRLDGFVGAVTGGFRGEFGHDQRRHQRSGRRHQRNRPRADEAGGPVAAALAQRRRQVVARQIAEQKLAGVFQREVENDGAQAGDDADRDPSSNHLADIPRPDAAPNRPPAAIGGAIVGLRGVLSGPPSCRVPHHVVLAAPQGPAQPPGNKRTESGYRGNSNHKEVQMPAVTADTLTLAADRRGPSGRHRTPGPSITTDRAATKARDFR